MHELFKQECIHLLDQSVLRIDHCLKQLTHEQLWWQPTEDQNSIGIVLRHIAGNLEQWAICGLTLEADRRNRESEFNAPERPSAESLLQDLMDVVSRARLAISELRPELLTAARTIQGFDVSVIGSLMHTIPHMVGHTHQIVTLTRLQLKEHYQFHWTADAPRDKVPL